MYKKYRIGIELLGVRFGIRYGTDLKKLIKKAKEDLLFYQKHVSKRDAKIYMDGDLGERYKQGERTRIHWKRVEIIEIPYEAKPDFEIGQQFVQYHEDDDTIKMEGVIVERRLDSKYDDFYYIIRRKGWDNEEYIHDEIELMESYLRSDWERKKEQVS